MHPSSNSLSTMLVIKLAMNVQSILPAGPLSTANTSMLVDAILRYYYYIEVGLDEAHVAPFRQEWAANVLELVPQGPSEHVSQVGQTNRFAQRCHC